MVWRDPMKSQDIIPRNMPVVGAATPNMPSVENSFYEHLVALVS